MDILQAIIIAIVEGITEFLPISSTGHMIITSSIMGIQTGEFTKLFEVSIQLGAILAVVVLYRKKFLEPILKGFKNISFYIKLIIGVMPALVLGFLFSDKIDELLESPRVVAITMILGGIVLLFIDKVFKNPTIHDEPGISNKNSLVIGFWQTIAMIPGVSRSAASIIGGMQQKLDRDTAAEFSFFLAVPTMAAATLYSLFLKHWMIDGIQMKCYDVILRSSENIIAFVIGNIVAFLVAILAIRLLITYLQRSGFKVFGYYRVIVGIVLLWWFNR
ncbi:MAG: undecaprenyl-diphosphate phosphatase [Saprospiraceae bacterium]|nr:undecaprenyl-diphosphate phosphatase [Saprospiraceae bacterium]